MRFGVFGLTPPAGSDPDRALEWAIGQASGMDIDVIGGDHRPTFRWGQFSCDHGYWSELRAKAEAGGFEIEPFVRTPFDVAGPGGAQARAALIESIRAAKCLGGPIMRTAYGNQTVSRTRFAPMPLADHLKLLTWQLREAAAVAESEGVVLAIENHTDFSGPEWATVFERVGSERIQCALDTGNGLTVFTDPAEDVRALALWTVTTHVKDMRVIENPRPDSGMSPRVPFGLTGCPIGDGCLDLRAMLRELADRTPRGSELALIVEPSWPEGSTEDDLPAKRNELVRLNLERLRAMVEELDV